MLFTHVMYRQTPNDAMLVYLHLNSEISITKEYSTGNGNEFLYSLHWPINTLVNDFYHPPTDRVDIESTESPRLNNYEKPKPRFSTNPNRKLTDFQLNRHENRNRRENRHRPRSIGISLRSVSVGFTHKNYVSVSVFWACSSSTLTR